MTHKKKPIEVALLLEFVNQFFAINRGSITGGVA